VINPSTNAAATNTATRFSVAVRRNLCLTSSNLKRRLFLTNYTNLLLIDYLNKNALFVAQRFDGIEIGCAIGGVQAEADADG
jgi:hypothetical protein